MLGIHELPTQWLQVYEQAHGYRKNCVELLCRALALEYKTVNNWGANFHRMPRHYSRILGIVYERLALLKERENVKPSQL